MKTYTTEEKKQYFADLRTRWADTKKLLNAKKISEIDAIIREHGMNISVFGYVFVAAQMKQQGLEGIPYVDAKTFLGWRESGFQVRRGEKSTLSGITWIRPGLEKDNTLKADADAGYMFPKEYHLFHRSQVDPLV